MIPVPSGAVACGRTNRYAARHERPGSASPGGPAARSSFEDHVQWLPINCVRVAAQPARKGWYRGEKGNNSYPLQTPLLSLFTPIRKLYRA